MLELISYFFDISFQLDLMLEKNDLNLGLVKNLIGLLKIVLQKSIQKCPLQDHILFRQKIDFYEKAFKIGKFNRKRIKLVVIGLFQNNCFIFGTDICDYSIMSL